MDGEDDDEYVWLPWGCHLASSSLSLALSLEGLGRFARAPTAPRILIAGRLVFAPIVCECASCRAGHCPRDLPLHRARVSGRQCFAER